MGIQSSLLRNEDVVKPEVMIWPKQKFIGKPILDVKMRHPGEREAGANETKPGNVTGVRTNEKQKDADNLRFPRATLDTHVHRERFLSVVVLREKTSVILLFIHKKGASFRPFRSHMHCERAVEQRKLGA